MNFLIMILSVIVFIMIVRSDMKQRIISYKLNVILLVLASINLIGVANWFSRLIIAFILFAAFYLVNFLTKKIFDKEVIGEADLLLISNLALLFGLKILSIIFWASFMGLLVHLALIVIQKQFKLEVKHPFGSYLSITAVIYIAKSFHLIFY